LVFSFFGAVNRLVNRLVHGYEIPAHSSGQFLAIGTIFFKVDIDELVKHGKGYLGCSVKGCSIVRFNHLNRSGAPRYHFYILGLIPLKKHWGEITLASFSERLKQLREERGLLQRELAETLKLSRVTVTNYEKGKRFPEADLLVNLADYFNVSVDYLIGRSERGETSKRISAPRPGQATQAQDGLKEVVAELRKTNELLLTIVTQILYRGCPEPEAAEEFLNVLVTRLKDVSAF
jgi:transcriptional regulator with XRE-family HTH domain